MIETQAGISEWADATFGPANDIRRILSRAFEEAAELVTHTVMPCPDLDKIAVECADIAIVLCRGARWAGDDRLVDDCVSLRGLINGGGIYGAALRVCDTLLNALRICEETGAQVGIVRLIGQAVIKLAEICHAIGHSLGECIDTKMARNRAREWRLDGSGHGYHTKEPEEISNAKSA